MRKILLRKISNQQNLKMLYNQEFANVVENLQREIFKLESSKSSTSINKMSTARYIERNQHAFNK